MHKPLVDSSWLDVTRVTVAGWFLFQVEGNFYVNDALEKLMFEELRNACRGGGALPLADGPPWSAGVKCCFLSVFQVLAASFRP